MNRFIHNNNNSRESKAKKFLLKSNRNWKWKWKRKGKIFWLFSSNLFIHSSRQYVLDSEFVFVFSYLSLNNVFFVLFLDENLRDFSLSTHLFIYILCKSQIKQNRKKNIYYSLVLRDKYLRENFTAFIILFVCLMVQDCHSFHSSQSRILFFPLFVH